MKFFCFAVVGFCCCAIPLCFVLHQFVACLALAVVAAIAFAIGRLSPRNVSVSQNASPVHVRPDNPLEVLPPAVARQTVTVPDIFDPDRIRQDLVSLADQPNLFAKYAERGRSRFNKAGERALLQQWITQQETGRRLIESRTEMEKARSQWLQLANEHALSIKQKDAEVAKLDADMEESALRRDTAEYKRKNLDRFVEGGNPLPKDTGPKLTPEQQRRLKRMEIEDKLKELDHLEAEALKTARSEGDRKRIENMYGDKRELLREKLSENLV